MDRTKEYSFVLSTVPRLHARSRLLDLGVCYGANACLREGGGGGSRMANVMEDDVNRNGATQQTIRQVLKQNILVLLTVLHKPLQSSNSQTKLQSFPWLDNVKSKSGNLLCRNNVCTTEEYIPIILKLFKTFSEY